MISPRREPLISRSVWVHGPASSRKGFEMSSRKSRSEIGIDAYGARALPHLGELVERNRRVMERLASQLVKDVRAGRSLMVFGSGHSALFPLELYHRAGGPSFVIPVVADFLLPTAGPSVVRALERAPGAATAVLARWLPRPGEMIWIASNSGINAAVIDLAIEARKRKLKPIAFTSLPHSQAVESRHASRKKLSDFCDEVVDTGGVLGDACVPLGRQVSAGPLSTLSTLFLGHSILVCAMARLEKQGFPCVYASVNTPEGERRNRKIESYAATRDFLLR